MLFNTFVQPVLDAAPQFFVVVPVDQPPWSVEEWQAFVERTVAEGPPPWWSEAEENGELEEAF